MGFQNENSGTVTWAKIANGKVVLTSKTQLEGYIGRTNKLGNQVYELFYDTFTGKLTNVRTQDGEYGVQWFFEFDDAGKTYIITTGYDNRYARTFLVRLLNDKIDFNQPITIKPYSFVTDEEKKMTGVTIIQNGKKMDPAFSYEQLPKPQEVKVKKQITYNYTEQMEFLEDLISKLVMPRLSGANTPVIKTDKDGFINIEDDIDKDEEINFFEGLQD